jgi:LuxR family transcriptional regulator, maltose regulon positive regulatory protein
MPKAALHTLRWLPACGEYVCLDGCEQVGIVTPSEHSQLLRWLYGGVDSFAFHGCAGAYTVRKERIRAGNAYWYAYRRVEGRVHKQYLGKSEAVTIERLEQAAVRFTEQEKQPGGVGAVIHSAQIDPIYPNATRVDKSDESGAMNDGPYTRNAFLQATSQARFKIPSPPHHIIPRPHLMEKLRAALAKPFTLVSASAGAGKSTLLSCWLASQNEILSAWISLESEDAGPVRFWNLIFTVFHALCPGCGADTLALLHVQQRVELERLLLQLLEQLRASQQEVLLVLDDYHHVEDAAIAQGMTFLLERLPENVHLVISTRVDPALPLARLRVRDQMVELRDADLRFTSSEAATFLARRAMLNVSQQEIDFLYERTEGWIAGLQLAAILLQRRNEKTDLFHAFSGGHRYIGDYLVQEVLEYLPQPVQHFLLYTSILERLQGKLCEAVTGQPDGQAILEWLERANLFLIPLDDTRQWYRYHHLFAEMLHQRLLQIAPELVPALHQRATRWFQAQGLTREAISHARATNDFAAIVSIIETNLSEMVHHGEAHIVRSWLDLLPRDLLYERPMLFFYTCWDLIGAVSADHAAEMLQEYARMHHLPPLETTDAGELERAIHRHVARGNPTQGDHKGCPYNDTEEARSSIVGADPCGRPGTLDEQAKNTHVSQLLLLYSVLALLRDNRVAFSQELTRRSDRYVHDRSRNRIVGHLWFIALRQGDIYGSIMALEEYLASLVDDSSNMLGFPAIYILAWLLTMTGQLHKIARIMQQILQTQGQPGIRVYQGQAYIALGAVEYEWNDLQQAEEHIHKGIELCCQFGIMESLIVGLGTLAKIRIAQGDESAARTFLQGDKRLAHVEGESASHSQLLSLWRAQLALALGEKMDTQHWMQAQVIEAPEKTSTFSPKLEGYSLLQAKLLLYLDRWWEAGPILHSLRVAAEKQKRHGSLLKIALLEALVHQAQGERKRAGTALMEALLLGEAEEYIRVFLDEQALLPLFIQLRETWYDEDAADRQKVSLHYLDRLISLFEQQATNDSLHRGIHILLNPLSRRELEVLQLIKAGKSNHEVAQQLVITVSTVKSHLNTIYSKLQVKSRTQAIMRASTLKLI